MNYGFFSVPRVYLLDDNLAKRIFDGMIVYSATASTNSDAISVLAKHDSFESVMRSYDVVVENGEFKGFSAMKPRQTG